jgi:hypothetical protein
MSARGKKEVRLVLGASPRVDLLPPEIADRKRDAAVRRAVVYGVIGAGVLIVAGFGLASVQAMDAGARNDEALARTTALLAEQTKYAEVRTLAERADTLADARQVGAMTEIDWNALYLRLVPTLPAGMTITSFTFGSGSPVMSLAAPTTPGQVPDAAEATFVTSAADLESAQSWIVALKTLPEYGGAMATSITREEVGTYVITVRLTLTSAAYSNRFAVEPETTTDAAVEPEGEN